MVGKFHGVLSVVAAGMAAILIALSPPLLELVKQALGFPPLFVHLSEPHRYSICFAVILSAAAVMEAQRARSAIGDLQSGETVSNAAKVGYRAGLGMLAVSIGLVIILVIRHV